MVYAFHLDTSTVYASEPTTPKGRYRIDGVPLGWFDTYIETPDGLFMANQVVNMPPKGEISVDLPKSQVMKKDVDGCAVLLQVEKRGRPGRIIGAAIVPDLQS